MSHRFGVQRVAALALFALAITPFAALTTTGVADAHESRNIGKYRFVVGFNVEPAFASEVNGTQVTITNTETSQPVLNAQQTLKVEVTQGSVKKEMAMTAVSATPGRYVATFIPTKDGQYIFRFFGELEGTQINETFMSGPGRFSDVQPLSAVQFPPETSAATTDTSAQTAQIQRQVTGLEASLRQAQDAANTARTIGFAGIIAGVVGIAIAAVAFTRKNSAA